MQPVLCLPMPRNILDDSDHASHRPSSIKLRREADADIERARWQRQQRIEVNSPATQHLRQPRLNDREGGFADDLGDQSSVQMAWLGVEQMTRLHLVDIAKAQRAVDADDADRQRFGHCAQCLLAVLKALLEAADAQLGSEQRATQIRISRLAFSQHDRWDARHEPPRSS
jgi:hypothetical protein